MISIRNELRNVGYVHLPSYQPGNSTEEILHSFGTPLSLGMASAVHQLTPKSKSGSTPNTYSGIFGRDKFPLHTDLAHWRFPPRFLMLRCIRGFEAVPTLLLDGLQIIGVDDRSTFSRALIRPRRPIGGALPLLRLYDRQQGDHGMLRWDEVFICPASQAGEIGVKKFAQHLAQSEPTRISLAEQGDTIIVDNWRMLHGRSPVPADCQQRVLERAYLESVH